MWLSRQYRRFAGLVILVLLAYAGLGWRLYCIQVVRHAELAAESRRYTHLDRLLPAWRGQILDRNKIPLDLSVPVGTVFADARLATNHPGQIARTCGALLEMPPAEVMRSLSRGQVGMGVRSGQSRKAVILKHNLPWAECEAVTNQLTQQTFGLSKSNLTPSQRTELGQLQHRLLFVRPGQIRSYPYGECGSRLLGFVAARKDGTGLQGVCGLERALDATLRGEPGRCISEQDAAGNELPARRSLYQLPKDGTNVVLTIDLRVQQIVEQCLVEGLTQTRARQASAVVMDPRTFEILSVACLPNFNPQHPGEGSSGLWRQPVFSDQVEPGSTFKLVTLAMALEQGRFTLDSRINCEGGHYVFDKVPIKDHARYGVLSLRECFAKSSNIGFAKVALEFGPQQFYRYITNFGFGRRTGVLLFDEAPGLIAAPNRWSTMRLTRAAFGQGLSVSQLQMTLATGVIANQGRLMRPLLVKRLESPDGQVLRTFEPQFVRTVLRPQTALLVTEAMKAVVARGGTGAAAAMRNHTLAAKTGTAQKSDRHGYLAERYYSSMIGFFPADAPQVVLSVALDEPQNGYYASSVVAPIFRAIAEQIADCLSIPPDRTILARSP